jgi:thiol-disulfide isomerase/thioredoxin
MRRSLVALAFAFSLLTPNPLRASDLPPVEAPLPWPDEIPLHVTDDRGEPIAGANVSARVIYVIDHPGDAATVLEAGHFGHTRQGDVWRPVTAPPTDAAGDTLLPTRVLLGKAVATLHGVDPTGHRIGAVRLRRDRAAASDRLSMTLRPAPLVRGTIGVAALAPFGKPARATLGFDGIDLAFSRDDGLQVIAFVPPDRFSIPLPPGHYTWGSWHPHAMRQHGELLVPEDAAEVEFPRIVLEPQRLLLLAGKPAPELTGLYGWANSPPLALADLRGKVVLLDFWGVWCGPCLAAMPDLAALHERYRDRGLVIIGVHCADREDPIETEDVLNRRLAIVRRGQPALPFPIALTRLPETDEYAGHGSPAQDYGVTSFPTAVLIARNGRLLGEIDVRADNANTSIESALAEPLAAPKPAESR